jgi:hypothetical protein
MMGKYSSTTQKESTLSKKKEPHPIWRGIGCVMMIVIPAISIFIGKGLVDVALANKVIKSKIPFELLGYPQIPDILYKSAGLKPYLYLLKVENLYLYIAVSIICMVVISSLISLAYAIAYRIANPYRYGPLDEPPSRIKAKKHTR